MAALVLVFLHRAKLGIKIAPFLHLFPVIVALVTVQLSASEFLSSRELSCGDIQCFHGTCRGDRCICDQGWDGSACQRCSGRVRLTGPSGHVTDGNGNYTVEMQCTWLIDSGSRNATIRLRLLHFETECSWDHLYIFDGDSIFAPLIAAFSGILVKEEKKHVSDFPEVVTHSGQAYLYFYSDAALNMSGFNISYRINGCPKDCSGRGPCVDGQCTCSAGWSGPGCDIAICPKDCNFGNCDKENHVCNCKPGYTGDDCSIPLEDDFWMIENMDDHIVGRALHQAVVFRDRMWILGGHSFSKNSFQHLISYNFHKRKWDDIYVRSVLRPSTRYGHSVVVYQNHMYMYGGLLEDGNVVNELWVLDPLAFTWSQVIGHREGHQCLSELCAPLAAGGHTANIVEGKMIIIFGHSPVYGYLNSVQEYDFVTGKWQLIHTKGAIVKGGYGHTSVYDPESQIIYVHGGYHSFGTDAVLVDGLYAYHPFDHDWTLLTPSSSPRYLHSSNLVNGLILAFGGNTHNSSHYSAGDNCFSQDFLVYNITCDYWYRKKFSVANSSILLGRYGHSSVVYNGSIYMFGGFNGQMLNSLLRFVISPTKQLGFLREKSYLKEGICPYKAANFTMLCSRQQTCPSCLRNAYDCVWCGTSCSYRKCGKGTKEVRDLMLCGDADSSNCDTLHNCHACHTEYHCGWQADNKCYTFVTEMGNRTEKAVLSDDYRVKCDAPCSSKTTCENCTKANCMWCSSSQRCIESNAYTAMFPAAQCMEWATQQWKCPGYMCHEIQTCDKCQQKPHCGWCDDGSSTGLGTCMDGSASGPVIFDGSQHRLNRDACSSKLWYFANCPGCQCNGHSVCENGTNQCKHPCQHLTDGSHCQHCTPGFFGNPVNGGNCTPCFCNGHGTLCQRENGKCYCTTKGIVGNLCDRCDESNHYFGNPQEDGGSCFYNLTIDFQYTFNLSKPEDKHFTHINFMNSPLKQDVDVDFSISCTEDAFVNISISSASLPEQILHENQECRSGTFKFRFSHAEHLFGIANTTFFVYVHGFTTPIIVQISFSQHRTLDLLQFFITFSSCFLSLLVIAAILWKIKQKYDLYRRRQRLFVEMEQMASRPSASVIIELFKLGEHGIAESLRKNHPTPIALEPCASSRAAVLSLIVQMPSGGDAYTLPGQSGLCIASALVSLGALGKGNLSAKEDCKIMASKPGAHPVTSV